MQSKSIPKINDHEIPGKCNRDIYRKLSLFSHTFHVVKYTYAYELIRPKESRSFVRFFFCLLFRE